ncbi:hypothetical protein FCM35_KLT08227 [Carex littledalei]|uniref:Uncharacterized protein n=1 Tax=Carex littledalei TaxID=544730 RepID=A0A833QVS9_9POAL|nr:hypothetical protein FCM35_KLT08227 [Carex littledalei]
MPRINEHHQLLHSVYGIQTDIHTTSKVDMCVFSCNSIDEEHKMVFVLEIILYDQTTILDCIESMNDYDKSYIYLLQSTTHA